MARKVTVELTVAEAKGLSAAAENTTMDPGAMEAIFPTGAERSAAHRGQAKLDRAIGAVGGWKP